MTRKLLRSVISDNSLSSLPDYNFKSEVKLGCIIEVEALAVFFLYAKRCALVSDLINY